MISDEILMKRTAVSDATSPLGSGMT